MGNIFDHFFKPTKEGNVIKESKPISFPPLSAMELIEILGLTIKSDQQNKLATFLCELSAYTENSQLNISFVAPSSTGKSYIPLEVAKLFPREDVIEIGYCSPTAFFHDKSQCRKETGEIEVNLERKILIFLDQPHTLLLQHLRPLLSHDKKEIHLKITDRSKRALRTKNIVLKGFPAVIFCTAGLKMEEQEATRFLLLSPEISQEKIREAILERIKKETDSQAYDLWLESDERRKDLKKRIEAIKEAKIKEIRISQPEEITKRFLSKYKPLKPRHSRDVSRLISLTKTFALLNLWDRRTKEEGIITATEEDFNDALQIWDSISESQELNLPPYIFNLYKEVVLPLWGPGILGLTRQDICKKHFEVYGRPLPDWQLRQEILPMWELAGLIFQEPDPDDKRRILIRPIEK